MTTSSTETWTDDDQAELQPGAPANGGDNGGAGGDSAPVLEAPAARQAPAKEPPPKKSKKVIVRLILLALFGLGAWKGGEYYLWSRNHESTDDAFVESHVTPVSARVAAHVERVYVDDNQVIRAGDLLLELDPRDFELRVAQASAALEVAKAKYRGAAVGVDVTRVTRQASIAQAEAGLNVAKSGVDAGNAMIAVAKSKQAQAAAMVTAAQAGVEEAQAAEAAANAEANRAKSDLARYRQLDPRSIAPQALDAAVAAAEASASQLMAAKKRVSSANAQVIEAKAAEQSAAETVKQAEAQLIEAKARVAEAQGKLDDANAAPQHIEVSKAQAMTAEAEVQQAQAILDQALRDLGKTRVYAPRPERPDRVIAHPVRRAWNLFGPRPIVGRIARKSVEPGQYVQVGQSLLAVVDPEVWIVANFKETQLTQMRPGQSVEIEVDTYPGHALKGHIDTIQPGTGSRFSMLPPENATGNYVKVVQRVPVKIVLDEAVPDGVVLAPGMSVVPSVELK